MDGWQEYAEQDAQYYMDGIHRHLCVDQYAIKSIQHLTQPVTVTGPKSRQQSHRRLKYR